MGWASGSELAEAVWRQVRPFIPKKDRAENARVIIALFEGHDCDTLYEAETLMEDAE